MDNIKLQKNMEKTINSEAILFAFQVFLIAIVVCVSLFNLTFQWGNQNLWTVILTGSLGYIMPNPKLKYSDDIKTEENKLQEISL